MTDTENRADIARELQALMELWHRISPIPEARIQQIIAENTCPECGHTFGWHRISINGEVTCSQSRFRTLDITIREEDATHA